MSYYSTTKPPRTTPLIEWARGRLTADSAVQGLLGAADEAAAEDVVHLHALPAERADRCGVVREEAQIGGRAVSLSRLVYAVIQVEWQCIKALDVHAWHDQMYEATWDALMGVVPSGADIDADLKLDALTEPDPPYVVEERPDLRYTTSSFAAVLNPT